MEAITMEQHKTEQYSYDTPPCVNCGSIDTESVKRRVGAAEKLTLLMFPIFIIVGFILGFNFFILCLALIDIFELGTEYSLIGCAASFMVTLPIGGGILAKLLSRLIIRKRRKKLNLSQKSYRCKACGKIFIPKSEL